MNIYEIRVICHVAGETPDHANQSADQIRDYLEALEAGHFTVTVEEVLRPSPIKGLYVRSHLAGPPKVDKPLRSHSSQEKAPWFSRVAKTPWMRWLLKWAFPIFLALMLIVWFLASLEALIVMWVWMLGGVALLLIKGVLWFFLVDRRPEWVSRFEVWLSRDLLRTIV